MNRWMLAAAAGLLLTTWVHVFLGGPEIHQIIQASDMHPGVRAIGAVLWHAVTVNLLVFAVACLWMSQRPNPALAILVCGIQIGFAALFVFYGLTLLGTVWLMPQWVIFLLVPAVMMMGLRRARTTQLPAP